MKPPKRRKPPIWDTVPDTGLSADPRHSISQQLPTITRSLLQRTAEVQQRIRAEQKEAESEFNSRAKPCEFCGHKTRIKNNVMFACIHYADDLKKLVDEDVRESGARTSPFQMISGIAIVIEDPRSAKNERQENAKNEREETEAGSGSQTETPGSD